MNENINHYFDAAATTQVDIEVFNAMQPYFIERYYNPSSLYSKSKEIKKEIDNARHIIANSINAKDNEIYFTSGGSESNCWAIQGFYKRHKCALVITSKLEHHSIIECCDDLSSDNIVDYINVNIDGTIDLESLENKLKLLPLFLPECQLYPIVSIQLANNEIGTIQNMQTIAEIVHKYNAVLHCDATQAYCHIPINVKELGVDMLTASGHKINAPKGIGFLYIRNGIDISPMIYGSQENGMRGGTENVPYIIGLAKAVELHQKCNNELYQKALAEVQSYLIKQLKENFDCHINGSLTNRLHNNVNVTFNLPITGEALIYMLDTAGIYISAGSACNSKSNEPSQVLKAIGLTNGQALKTIRITIPNLIIKAYGSLFEIKTDSEYQLIISIAKCAINQLTNEIKKACDVLVFKSIEDKINEVFK